MTNEDAMAKLANMSPDEIAALMSEREVEQTGSTITPEEITARRSGRFPKLSDEQWSGVKAARRMSPEEVIANVQSAVPAIRDVVHPACEIVGKWVWATFSAKPEQKITNWMFLNGFKWNNKRKLWQHACGGGRGRFNAKTDPRQTYGRKPLD